MERFGPLPDADVTGECRSVMRLHQQFQDLKVDDPEPVMLPQQTGPHVTREAGGDRRIVGLLIGFFVLGGHGSVSIEGSCGVVGRSRFWP